MANVAYQKESFVSSKRGQQKRHSGTTLTSTSTTRWVRGHAGRAVDGHADQTLHSCTVLDNFYVDRPVWMVDLQRQTAVSGVIIVTRQDTDNGNITSHCRALITVT